MRWKTPRGLKMGDTRQVQYFALLPTKLDDGYTVWLERYWAEEMWNGYADDDRHIGGWLQIKSWSKK